MTAFFLLIGLLFPTLGMAAENFPPPEFSWGYEFPHPSVPAPRAPLLAWIDMVMLAMMLFAAAWFVYRSRSRAHLFILAAFSVAYFGFWRKGCVCSVGSIQNVALSFTDPVYGVSLAVAVFFLLPLLVALFFGRLFCAGACPLGALQDVVLLRPLRVPKWLDSSLSLIPWIYLGAALLFAILGSDFIICRYDPFIIFYRLGGTPLMLGIGAAIVLLAVFIGRPYCRYLCPYGVLLGLCSRVSWQQVKLTAGQCINCHLCAEACPFGAIRPPTAEPGSVARREGRWRLGLLIILFPVILVAGSFLGRLSSPILAKVDPTVRLADRVFLEEKGLVEGQTLATEAFARQARSPQELYQQAAVIHGKYQLGGTLFGLWLGLICGARMIRLSLRRHRVEYDIDSAACVACGRCLSVCPVERQRRNTIPG